MKTKLQILTFCLALMVFGLVFKPIAYAVTAYPHPIEFTQKDGSKLTILLKGDEKVKWALTKDGYTILFNSQGVYEYAILNERNEMVPSGIQAHDPESRKVEELEFLKSVEKGIFFSKAQIATMKQIWETYDKDVKAFPTTGNRKLLCILVNYTDVKFTRTRQEMDNLFNQIGYTFDGATGSVKDYFLENSYNQFNLTVDVVGPFMVSNTMAYYGANDGSGNDLRPREMVTEAVNLADPVVNYANYDNDNDGTVDGIYVIYAGYDESAGGPAEAIWAHKWSITTVVKDGKSINTYSCSSELRGNSGTGITRIGVICHEFGHTLGAPDYYDTDYDTNGLFEGTGNWDLQAAGSWNGASGEGETPAHSNPYTKIVTYGWATATVLSTAQDITMYNSTFNKGSFYRVNTATTNEYYLLENRQQVGFDAAVPGHGLMIYHVHASIASPINNAHPQEMYPVCASATVQQPTSTPSTYGVINGQGCPWPGASGKTTFDDNSTPWARAWNSSLTNKPITEITEIAYNKTITFKFMGGYTCTKPTVQAIGFSGTNINTTSMTVSWVRGNGNNCLVIARAGGEVNAFPVSGTSYTASATFGSGSQIGTGNYVIYNGTGTSVNLTGLTANTTYYFAIYEYNTTGNCYLQPGYTGSIATAHVPAPPTANFTSNKTSTLAGGEIEFTETCTGTVTSYEWTFYGGMPSTSTDRTPVISYFDPGTYTVSLKATNADGSNTMTKTNYITVTSLPSLPATNPVTIGTGTTSGTYFPLGISSQIANPYKYVRSASIYNAAEIGGGGVITKIEYRPSTSRTDARVGQIWVKHTTDNTFTASPVANYLAGATLIYQGTFTPNVAGWFAFTPQNTFVYNGVDNLMVIVLVETQATPGNVPSNCYYTTAANKHQQWNGTTIPTGNGTVNGNRPNIRLTFSIPTAPTANFAGLGAPFFTENFDGATFPPTGWIINNQDGGGNTWVRSTAQNHNFGGSSSAAHLYHATQNENGYLITPQITSLPTNSALSFWSYNAYPTWYGNNAVLISTTGTASANFTQIWSPTSVTEAWVNTTLDLSAYAGQNIYIAFRYQGVDAHNWFVDEVSIASFNYTQINTYEGDEVTIYDKSTNNPTCWEWTLNGATPNKVTSKDATVTYNTAGLYPVTLKVANLGGSNTKTVTEFVNVQGRAPIANYEAIGNLKTSTFQAFSPIGGSVNFNDLSTRAPAAWNWTTTGGYPATSTSKNVTVTYNTGGTYSSSLKVSNAYGTDTKSVSNNVLIGGTSYLTTLIPGDLIRKYSMTADTNRRLPGHCYFTSGTTNYYEYEYADFYSNSYPGQITKFNIYVNNAVGTGKNVVFKVWDGREGNPGTVLGSKTVAITSLTAGSVNTITFDTPIDVPGDFYVGFQVFYDGLTTSHNYTTHNFCSRMAQSRVGDNVKYTTLMFRIGATAAPDANSFWYPLAWVFGIESSLALWPEFTYNAPPVAANFAASPTNLTPGGSTNFTDLSTGNPTSWNWTFQGGTPATSTAQNPTVTYAAAGTYMVSLKVSNGTSTNTKTVSGYITVSAPLVTPGDVNGDGFVNVLDVVWLVSHLNGSTPPGFIMGNADVNGDSVVNISDLPALINLILSGAKSSNITSETAHLYLGQDGTVALNSDGTLLALQFELKGQQIDPANIEKLLSSDFIIAFNEQTGLGVIYSMNNTIIPEGYVNLFRINNVDINLLTWGIAEAANISFNTVPVITHLNNLATGAIVNNFIANNVVVSPNPNNGSYIIDINLNSNEFIKVELLDEKGRVVSGLDRIQCYVGENKIRSNNPNISTGLYLIRIIALDDKGYQKSILYKGKLMIVK